MTLASTRQNCSPVANTSYEGNQTVLNRTRPDCFSVCIYRMMGSKKGITMTTFDDSLRGYGHRHVHQRDNFTCRYCGVDGRTSFDVWLTLSVDHLLPKGHPERENPDYMVTACNFCNAADNHYFTKYGLTFDGLTPDQLVERRREKVQIVRDRNRKFWEENVKPTSE